MRARALQMQSTSSDGKCEGRGRKRTSFLCGGTEGSLATAADAAPPAAKRPARVRVIDGATKDEIKCILARCGLPNELPGLEACFEELHDREDALARLRGEKMLRLT